MVQNSVSQKKRQGNQAKCPILQQNRSNIVNHSGPKLSTERPMSSFSYIQRMDWTFQFRIKVSMLNKPVFVTFLSPCIYFPQVYTKNSNLDSYFITNFHWENLNFGFTIFPTCIPLALNTACLFLPGI